MNPFRNLSSILSPSLVVVCTNNPPPFGYTDLKPINKVSTTTIKSN